jgi:predicted RNA-binding Zn-ribbon protein involved in translation (DUF1610 family)
MAEITCPECGQITDLVAIRRAADEFCSHCDYPLFWAPSSVPLVTGGPSSDTTLRRLPGAGGRMLVGTQVCPACGELNPMSVTHCIRCTADLNPPPPEPEPEPLPVPPPPPVVDESNRWWLWLLLAVAFMIVTVVVIVLVA